MECREERRLQRLQKQLQRLHLLILDELGYVPFTKTGAELLFEVISRAYEHQSVMVTSNLPFEQWTEVFGQSDLQMHCWTESPIDAISWRLMAKVIGYARLRNDPSAGQNANKIHTLKTVKIKKRRGLTINRQVVYL